MKSTQSSPHVLAETVMYDPELTLSLPKMVTATSGMNAIAHAVEALYAPGASPLVALMAEEGIRVMAAAPEAMARVARALGAANAATGLWNLERSLDTPRSLREIGMSEAGLDRAVELLLQSAYPNPRKPDADSLRRLLERAQMSEPSEYD